MKNRASKKNFGDLRMICPHCFSIVQYEEFRKNKIGSQGIYYLLFNENDLELDIKCDICKNINSISKWAEIFVKLTRKQRTFRYITNERV